MKPKANGSALKWLLTVTVLIALFTGFGNMPLYGRYYIANIPGFQWSGNFIVNMKVHLVIGAVIMALAIYWLIGFVRLRRKLTELTAPQKLTGLSVALVLLSGLLAALKNFALLKPGLALNMGINFFHMGTALLLAVLGLVVLVVRPKKEQS